MPQNYKITFNYPLPATTKNKPYPISPDTALPRMKVWHNSIDNLINAEVVAKLTPERFNRASLEKLNKIINKIRINNCFD